MTPAERRAMFMAVMDFLERHGFVIQEGFDGDPAYHGGHTQAHLADVFAEEKSP